MEIISQGTYAENIIEDTAEWTLRRIYVNSFGKMVLAKDQKTSSLENKAKMLYEYEIAKKQNSSWLLKPLALESIQKKNVIYYEDFHGVSLRAFLQQRVSIPHFLAIAIELTNACLSLHQQNILFRSLHPQNILVHPTSLRIKLLSSEYMSYIEADALSSTENPYDRLAYMSYLAPEQTGRLNWEVDYRVDLYALGAIFYEMLSGKKLFQALNPVDLIYKIITKKPESLSAIQEDIPVVLSEIVEKLLQKNPESRYQSVLGLKEDLVRLQKMLMEEKPLSQFPLAQQDIQINIRYTTKLYGREQSLEQLQTIFQKVEKGEKRLIFISGDSGIGKSSLVNGLKQSIAASRGYFVSAKFDQLKDDTPFAPIILLLRNLLKQIYLEGNHSVIQWKKLFEEEDLQPTPQLINLVPELSWFIKGTVELFSETTENAKQLYALVYSSIQKFFIAFAKQRLPIVLFVDDVQWAFNQALETLRQIFQDHGYGYILLIVAYRQEEVSYPHPVLTWQEQCEAHEKIQLTLLDLDTVCYWIADIFQSQQPVIESVGRQLHYLTKGNPFFVKQALISFQRHQIIYYDMESKIWNFDLSKMQQLISDERLLTFIEKRMADLSLEAQNILKLVSCFGKQFEINYLLKLVKESPVQILAYIQRLVEEGFIVPLNTYYKWAAAFEQEGILQEYELQFQFVHDRIQQVAYMKLTDEERTYYHLKIGQLLEAEISKHKNRGILTEVVKHYNYCKHVLNVDEKEKLAQWNYQLGLNSKKSGMFKIALVFFNTSSELLPENHWENARDLSLALYSNIGECEYLVGQYEKSEKYLNIALSYANSRVERLSIYLLKLFLYAESENIEEGYKCGIEALEAGGISIPRSALKLQAAKELLMLKLSLRNKSDAVLLQLSRTDEKEMKLIHQIIIQLSGNSYRLNPELTGILMLRSMRLMLQDGATDDLGVVFINYALLLKAGFDDIEGSYRFGRLAVTIAEQQNNIYQKAHNYFVYGVFINHGIDTYDKNIYYLRLAQQYSKELGIHLIVSAAGSFLCLTMLIKGHSLDEIGQEIERQLSASNKKTVLFDYLYEFNQWIQTLKLTDKEEDWNYSFVRQDDESVKIMHYVLRLKMSYLLENIEQAEIILDELRQPVKDTFSLIVTPYYYYYRALWQMKWIQQGTRSHSQKALYEKEIKQSIKKLRKWAKYAPQNYKHLYMLLLAEHISMKGISREAIYYYDRAIQFAHIHGYTQDEAVASERAANYYLSLQDEKMAKIFIERAARLMHTWGAPKVLKRWERQYATILIPSLPVQEVKPISFDVMTVLETTNSISQATKMEDLLQKLLTTILKQAAATRGYFIQKLDADYSVVAMAESQQAKFIAYGYRSLEEFPEILQYVVRYCLQSGENINISNVQASMQFPIGSSDEKSILCLPIWYKGEITAILYLENNVLWNAFNDEKVEILKMISTQIAVSIENVRMYEELEDRVEERTKELADVNVHLREVNQRLQKNEIERKKILHSISHELRSPITSAIGYVEAILDGVVKDEQQQKLYLHKSKDRLLSLNRLIQDLFDLAHLEAGRMEFTFSKIHAQMLFDELAVRFEDEVNDSGLVFASRNHLVQDVLVMVDERRIEQVVTNLIRNAIKYTKQGTIHFEMYKEHDKCIFSVEDNGMGIAKEDIPFVFESYFGGSNNTNIESHGIGLAICKQIITQHGGEIYVESTEGKGAKFSFTLPIVE